MLLALELLLIGQLAAGREHAVLRLERGGIGTDRLGRGRRRTGGSAAPATPLAALAICNAGDEAFQISLLLGLEVAGLRAVVPLRSASLIPPATPVGAVSGAGAVLRDLCVR